MALNYNIDISDLSELLNVVNYTSFDNKINEASEYPTTWDDDDAYTVEDDQRQITWKDFYIRILLLLISTLVGIGIGAIIYLFVKSCRRYRRQSAFHDQISNASCWYSDPDFRVISPPSYAIASGLPAYNEAVAQPAMMAAIPAAAIPAAAIPAAAIPAAAIPAEAIPAPPLPVARLSEGENHSARQPMKRRHSLPNMWETSAL